jgi:hypothetical protein
MLAVVVSPCRLMHRLKRNCAPRLEGLIARGFSRFGGTCIGGLTSLLVALELLWGNSTGLAAVDTDPSPPARAEFLKNYPWPPFDPSNPEQASLTNIPAGDRFARGFFISEPSQPDPLGDLVLSFPTNGSSVPRIVDISGRYRGTSTSASNRNYTVDIGQDESGKLSLLCTVDGLLGKTGSAQISSVGFIRTVQGQPMLRLRGSLNGTLDGTSFRANGTFNAPAALASFSGRAYGLTSTGSFSGKLGDAPFSGRKRPLQIPLLTEAGANIHDSWTLALKFSRKTVGKTERTFASAQLALPSGATIQFPERPARYLKSGYTLSFVGGTNVTANPPVRNHRASIGIRRLGLTQQGESWTVTSGTIRYSFLGQAGTGDLAAFPLSSAKRGATAKASGK